MRVEAGRGGDHDTGTVDGWNELTGLAKIRWDSGVVTTCPIALLRARPGSGQPGNPHEFYENKILVRLHK